MIFTEIGLKILLLATFEYHQIIYDLKNHYGFEKQFSLLNNEERLILLITK